MSSRTGQRIRSAVVSLSMSGVLLVPLAFGLTACGGGQAPDPAAPPDERPAAARAAPGEVVVLQPSGELLAEPVRVFDWSQVGGPAVELEDAGSPQAHFAMPAVEAGTQLSFALTVERESGEVLVELRRVECGRGSEHHGPPSPPPQFAVFTATKDLATRVDLYLARLDGSEVFRLNGTLPPGGFTSNAVISPGRRYVAYLADEDTLGTRELFVARADGGGVTKVSGPLVDGGDVLFFAWAPDGSRLAYWADELEDGRVELFTVRPDGAGHARASGPLVAVGTVLLSDVNWAPDGARLAYAAVQYTAGVVELFTSRADGTDNVRVSAPRVAGGAFGRFAWAPDASRIAYLAAERTAGVFELFTIRGDGTDHAVVSGPLGPDGDVQSSFAWSPDGSRIAYVADQVFNDRNELFTALPDGSGETLASALRGGDADVFEFAWSPDGTRIAYRADQDTEDVRELYTSGPDGESNVRASGPLAAGDLVIPDWEWSPAGDRIGYLVFRAGLGTVLLTVGASGNGLALVSDPLVAGGGVLEFQWSPDGSWIAYQADQLVDDRLDLFVAPPGGGGSTRVSGDSVPDGDVLGFQWSADGARLLYRADQLVNDQAELFVAAPDGGAVNAAISGPLTSGGYVFDFRTR